MTIKKYNTIILLSICTLFYIIPILFFNKPNTHLPQLVSSPSFTLQEGINSNSSSLPLYAKSAILYNSESGRILYSKNSDEKMPMASTTKIMTCIVALELGTPNDIINISPYAASMPDVQLNIKKGEQYYLKDLLYSLMLESHNDVAAAIAEHIGCKIQKNNTDTISNNSYEASKLYIKTFTDYMTKKAISLGCKNTSFITPNGLDADNHYTTAKELAIITSYTIKNKEFLSITNAPSHTFSDVNNKITHCVNNKNQFLQLYDNAIGCKTGYTSKAGYCFVGAVSKNDMTLISVVLASGWPPHKTYKWSDTVKLMDYGYNNYVNTDILDNTLPLPSIPIKDKFFNSKLIPTINDTLNLPISSNDKITVLTVTPKYINCPIKKNQNVGYMQIYINNTLFKEIPLYSNKNIEKKDFKYYLKSFIYNYFELSFINPKLFTTNLTNRL